MNFGLFLLLRLLLLNSVLAFTLPVMEEVVIVEGPSSGYVVKNRPYPLKCKALNAKKIRFKCNSKWIDESRIESKLGTDASSQMAFMEAHVEITRAEVEAAFPMEDFSCQCYASRTSDSDVVRSDSSRIRSAYMRKHFGTTPQSQRVHEGLTVQLQCSPPESEPKAQVIWLKDGQPIEQGADSNIIYGNDGSLILSAARLSDSGAYACEATNIATKRVTDTAQLTVYVDGQWSDWAQWEGSCQVDCGLLRAALGSGEDGVIPRKRRTRTCNNPAPLNGGAHCFGVDEEYKHCDIPCKIDGRWTEWSDWSECSPEHCTQSRQRKCAHPPPLNGGADCVGIVMETVNCTSHCERNVERSHQSPAIPPQSSTLSSHDVPLLIGMCSIFVLLALILGALCWILMCRKNRKKSSNNIYYAETGGHMRRVLLEQQQATLLAQDCIKLPAGDLFSPSPIHPTMTLRSAKSAYSAYTSNRNAGSRAALITECSSNSSSERGRKTLLRSNSNCSEDENYATLYDYMEEKSVQSIQNAQSVLVAQIDANGARLQLQKAGASLLVPEGAVEMERTVYIAVSEQPGDRPKLPPGEIAVSAVVTMGEAEWEGDPESRILQRPAILSFRHCAATFPRDNWAFSVWADEGFGWKQVVRVGEENLNSPVHVHLENPSSGRIGIVHLMTEHFGRFMLAGRSRRTSVAPCKRVHLACFGPPNPGRDDFELRTYCVPETGASMEAVGRQEAGARPLAISEHFILQPSGDLCFCVEEISPGFTLKGSPVVEIPATHHQWCSQNGLHSSIAIANSERRRPEEFNCRIVIYQKTNNAERHVLNVQLDTSGLQPNDEADKVVDINFQLPIDVKDSLAALLDPPTDPARDWRGLAGKLKLDKYLQYFATRPGQSPTCLLLSLWEAVEKDSLRAVPDLLQTLRVMGRPDAVMLLEGVLLSPPSPPPSAPLPLPPMSPSPFTYNQRQASYSR
ncbi:unnamed protein product, partial [Mesorhabditis belari]|uniref:Netrin receptor UNC5 n=1 Tax=Mesorhabditis belari TaxID=2138241 RepID=A0AAF3FFH9_9BILA